jgi:hypothetical protein
MTAQPPACALCTHVIAPGDGTTLPDIGKDGIPVSRPVHRECARQAVKENEMQRKLAGS